MAETAFRYLKWGNDVIGIIHANLSVTFTDPCYNTIVRVYSKGQTHWTPDEFLAFLSERIMSSSRRDIEKLLFRCGLSAYDTFRIADVTHAINPRDELWIARRGNDRIQDAVTTVFDSVFLDKIDAQGDSVDTPEGCNVKRYAALNGAYGIVKQRISPLTTDVESEIASFLLAEEMHVPCCPAYRYDRNSVFSQFCYDFTKEYIVHVRRFFNGPRGENELQNLLAIRPQFANDFYRMVLFDFVTRQDDRHLSNIAIKVTTAGESFYPLYDNGRSLFYEDTEEFTQIAAANPTAYATTFGYTGTYWDHLRDIASSGVKLRDIANLSISEKTIRAILSDAGFSGYRFNAAAEWILRCLELARAL